METKRAVIYSHGFCGANNALKDAKEIGKAMQSWAKEQGLLPVELIIEISDQSCGIFSPGLDRCTTSILNDDADVMLYSVKMQFLMISMMSSILYQKLKMKGRK